MHTSWHRGWSGIALLAASALAQDEPVWLLHLRTVH